MSPLDNCFNIVNLFECERESKLSSAQMIGDLFKVKVRVPS